MPATVRSSPWVELTDGPRFQRLLNLVDQNHGSLRQLEAQVAQQVAASWVAAGNEFSEQIALVVRNNPGRALAQILSRPDIQESLHLPFTTAVDRTRTALNRGWTRGAALGMRSAGPELRLLGLGITLPAASTTSQYLESLLSDLENNASQMVGRLLAAAEDGFPGGAAGLTNSIGRVSGDLSRRAGAGASGSVNRAYSHSQLTAYEQAAQTHNVLIGKVWVTSFSPQTCATCAALHGTVVSLQQEFSHSQTFGAASPPSVYGDLMHPPRHPHCRCRLMPHIEPLPQEAAGPSPASMAEAGRQFANARAAQAPRTWSVGEPSDIAKNTKFLTSADVRNMSEGRFELAKRIFRACMVRMRRR